MNTLLMKYFHIRISTKYLLASIAAMTPAIFLGIMLGLNHWIVVPIFTAVMLLLISLKQPNLLIWILIIVTLAYRLFSVRIFDLTNLTIPIILMILIIANRLFWFRFVWKKSILTAPILLLTILSILFSFGAFKYNLIKYWLLFTFLFVFYFFLFDIIVRGKKLLTAIWVFIITNSLIVTGGIISTVYKITEIQIFRLNFLIVDGEGGRLAGLSSGPIQLALLSLFCSAILLFISSSYQGIKKIIILLLLLLNIAGAVFTQSRAALIGFVVGLILLALQNRKLLILRIIPLFVILLFVIQISSMDFGYNLSTRYSPEYLLEIEQGNATSRANLFRAGIEIFLRNPFGYGFGATNFLMEKQIGEVISVHNMFLANAIDFGVFGLIAWVWVSWISVVKLWKISFYKYISPFDRSLCMGFFTIMITIWINFFAHNFINWIPLWIILAMLSAFIYQVDNRQSRLSSAVSS